MNKLIAQLRILLRRVKRLDSELYDEFVVLGRKIQDEFLRLYGRPRFMGWIDPIFKPPKGDESERKRPRAAPRRSRRTSRRR